MKRAKVITVAALFLALTFPAFQILAAPTPSPTPIPAVWVYWAGETNANGVYCHDGDFNNQDRFINTSYPQREIVYGLPIGYWTIIDGGERLYLAEDSSPADVDFDALTWTLGEYGTLPVPRTADIDCTTSPDPTPDPNITPTPSVTPTPTAVPSATPEGYLTPTPTPVPTATPVGYPTPPIELERQKISLYYDFNTQTGVVDQKLLLDSTGKAYTTRPGHRLMITNIDWSAASAATGTLEWDMATDRRVDKVLFTDWQGKVSGPFIPPKRGEPGVSLVLTIDAASTGTVQVEGYLEP